MYGFSEIVQRVPRKVKASTNMLEVARLFIARLFNMLSQINKHILSKFVFYKRIIYTNAQ